MHEIRATDVGKTSFEGVVINFCFDSPYQKDGENQYYFKVMPQVEGDPNVISATNGRTEKCKILNKKDSCYFGVQSHEYENINTLALSAIFEGLDSQNITMYLNIVPASIIDSVRIHGGNIKDYLPSEKHHNFKSNLTFYNIVTKEKLPKDEDYYVLVQLTPGFISNGTFFVSANDNRNNTIVHYISNPQMFFLEI